MNIGDDDPRALRGLVVTGDAGVPLIDTCIGMNVCNVCTYIYTYT